MSIKTSSLPSQDQATDLTAPHDELKTVAKGAGITFLGKVFGGGFQYLYVILVAKMLGTKEFGLFMLGLTIVDGVGVLGRLGMEGGVVRFVSHNLGCGEPGRAKGAIICTLAVAVTVSAAGGAALFFLADLLADSVFGKPELASTLRLLAPTVPFVSMGVVAFNATQGFQKMEYTVYGQSLFSPVTNLTLALGCYFAGFGLREIAAAWGITAVSTTVLALFFVVRHRFGAPAVITRTEVSELFRFSVPFLAIMLLMYLLVWTDTLVMGYYRPAAEVGIYGAAVKTAMFLNTVLLCFGHIFSPVIAGLHAKGDTPRMASLYSTVTRWTYTISLPLFLFMVVSSSDIMTLFGRDYGAGWLTLAILAFAQFVNSCTGPAAHLLVMSGRQDLLVATSLVTCVVNLLLNLIWVPPFGGVGAAGASLISLVIFNFVMLLQARRSLGTQPYNRRFLPPTLAGAVSCLVLCLILYAAAFEHPFFRLTVSVLVLFGGYVALLTLSRLREDDRVVVDAICDKWRTIRNSVFGAV